MTVLNEAATPLRLLGEPTDPLGPAASLSTDTTPSHSSPSPAEAAGGDEAGSVLIYCNGEPHLAPRWGHSFALCRCGELVRVVW